jgi:hypothetical protein
MGAKVEKGKRWFKFVLLMLGIMAGIKALFALSHPSAANKLAEALIQFIGGTIVFGGLGFILGWLAGKDDPSTADSASSAATLEIPPGKTPSPQRRNLFQKALSMRTLHIPRH